MDNEPRRGWFGRWASAKPKATLITLIGREEWMTEKEAI